MRLAVSSYDSVSTLTDGRGLLNLAWTLDEREFLSVDLKSVISHELQAEICNDLEFVQSYFVKDPYGEDTFGPAVAAFFARTGWSCCVACGAGVNSLLHSLARLADGEPAYIVGNVYPDFPFWIERSAGKCVSRFSHSHVEAPVGPSVEDHVRSSNAAGAHLIFLERPSLIGDEFSDLAELKALCDGVAPRNTMVVVDESNANYYPPAFSAVNLVDELENIIVLRGFSKAYGLGGLRLGYCVASNALRERVKSVMPPLLASSLSIRIGRRVLELGDIAAPLRARISQQKKAAKALLEGAQVGEVLSSSQYLPYTLLKDSRESVQSRLKNAGVLGKLHPMWSETVRDISYLYRLSTPLRAERMDLLRQKISMAR